MAVTSPIVPSELQNSILKQIRGDMVTFSTVEVN